jgi:hypothetical protein
MAIETINIAVLKVFRFRLFIANEVNEKLIVNHLSLREFII